MSDKLLESLEDVELWALLGQKGWREAVEALPKAQAVRLQQLLAKAGEPLQKTKEKSAGGGQEDRFLDTYETARIIGFSRSWIYQNHHTLPFARVMSNGRVRFSANGIQAWLSKQ